MRILVTGGSGFIGTNFIKRNHDNHDITLYDLVSTEDYNSNFIEGSILDYEKILDVTKEHDVIIHLAAKVGVKKTEDDLISTLDTNILGTRNILKACKENKIKKIIFSSSSEVYGEPKRVPIKETENPTPVTTYGISKLVSEEYIKSYSKKFGVKYSILRFFNVTGPNQTNNFVLPEFVYNAKHDLPIRIHGSGKQVRAFCHVDDVCQALEKTLTAGDNDVFNIGNDKEPITISELAEKVIAEINSKSKIEFQKFEDSGRNRSVEILNRFPCIKKAEEILSFKPTLDLKHSIRSIASGF